MEMRLLRLVCLTSSERESYMYFDSQFLKMQVSPIQKICCDFCHVGPTFSQKPLRQSNFVEITQTQPTQITL